MTDSEVIGRVWALKQKFLGPKFRLYLYGSRATGQNDAFSDFDFLVKGKAQIPAEKWFQLTDGIEALSTLFKIELVDFHRSSTGFLKVIKPQLKEVVNGKIRKAATRTNRTHTSP